MGGSLIPKTSAFVRSVPAEMQQCELELTSESFVFVFLEWTKGMDLHGPVFATEPPHRIEFSNISGGRVDCTGNGSPQPEVEWIFPDGTPVQQVKKPLQPLFRSFTSSFRLQICGFWYQMVRCGSPLFPTNATKWMFTALSTNASWKAPWVRSWVGTCTSRPVSSSVTPIHSIFATEQCK